MKYYNEKQARMAFWTLASMIGGNRELMPKEVRDALRLLRRDHVASTGRIKQELGWAWHGNSHHVLNVMESVGLIRRKGFTKSKITGSRQVVWAAV